MKVTNLLHLPQPIFDAVANDPYSRGDADLSVTELLAPPRQVALKRRHWDEIEEDCSDRIWSLCGQVVHSILERANRTEIAERRLSITVEGWKISGGMDLYHQNGTLQDYKFVTAYKFKGGQVPEEYEQQVNCYAEILRSNGERVEKLQIVGILRDWSKGEARRDPMFPQSQVILLNVPLWSQERARLFLKERVILHKQARIALPFCSPKDRWARPDQYAVMKQGGKRALKLYESSEEALAHAAQSQDLFVMTRIGENVRCRDYCSVSRFCDQYQALLTSQAPVSPSVMEAV